jgi:hypothetical protein
LERPINGSQPVKEGKRCRRLVIRIRQADDLWRRQGPVVFFVAAARQIAADLFPLRMPSRPVRGKVCSQRMRPWGIWTFVCPIVLASTRIGLFNKPLKCACFPATMTF